jgi:hypothetical protein
VSTAPKTLNIGPGLALPLDAVTRTFGILAQKGAGKTATASVMVEEMLGHGLPLVVIDPTGAWWGLRSSSDGRNDGLPITILGGDHADLPLEPTAGSIVADLVVDDRVALVIDLSAFSLGQQRRFVTDFAERLYDRNREPLHLVIDEADEFASQRIPPGHERMVGAINRIVRRGRIKGLGVTMISQRSAVIAKDVLTQIDTLIVLRTTSPQDRAAIDAWVSQNGTPEQRAEMLGSLASLPVGTAWVWSPGWLKIFQRVQVRRRRTFDSSATPKVGAVVKAPTVLAQVDLEAIRSRMAETIERVKADDPNELRRQIAELRAASKEPRIEHVPTLPDGFLRQLDVLEAAIEASHTELVRMRDLALTFDTARLAASVPIERKSPPTGDAPTRAQRRRAITTPSAPAAPAAPANAAAMPPGERKVLTAIAQHRGGCTREQLTVLTGYKRSSRDTYLQRMFAAGLIDRSGDSIVATSAGIAALGSRFAKLPTGAALREHWLSRLPPGERTVLEVAVAAFPGAVSRDRISAVTDYKRSSRDTYLQRLAARRLVEIVSGDIRASAELFDGGSR